ncbi:MAG: hypothetical protein L0387_35715 [Acidobacteria bacterium]|nr:hypothetical protein [Acidobacteriota bacterium]
MADRIVVAFAPNAASLLEFLCKKRDSVIYEVTLENGKRVQFLRERPFGSVREGAEYLRRRFGWRWDSKYWIMSGDQEAEMLRFFDESGSKTSSRS